MAFSGSGNVAVEQVRLTLTTLSSSGQNFDLGNPSSCEQHIMVRVSTVAVWPAQSWPSPGFFLLVGGTRANVQPLQCGSICRKMADRNELHTRTSEKNVQNVWKAHREDQWPHSRQMPGSVNCTQQRRTEL